MRNCFKHSFAVLIVIAFLAMALSACSKDSTDPSHDETPLTIIFDTDLGNCTDDAFAMQALFTYASNNQCKVAAVMQSRRTDKCKKLADCFLHYYKADDVPLGVLDGDEEISFKIVPYYELADSIKPDGTPLYPGTGTPLSSRLPAYKLYRKLLSEAADNSITIVCTGMFTNLGMLVESEADEYSPLSGLELISKKVKGLHITGGCFTPMVLRYEGPDETAKILEIEYNVAGDVPLAKKVIDNWPTPLYIFPIEEGLNFPSIHDRVLSDYKWQPENPIFQIYDRYDEWAAGDVGQYLWDAVTMLHPILGEESFQCSPQGRIFIDSDGRTTFSIEHGAPHHIISVNAYGNALLWDVLSEISGYKP